MLGVNKEVIVYEVKQQAMELRRMELGIYVYRYSNLAQVATIGAGFTLHSMAVLRVPEALEDHRNSDIIDALKFIFLISATCAFGAAMYVVAIASFTVVYGSWIALLGKDGRSVQIAIDVMTSQHTILWSMCIVGGVAVTIAASVLMWLKAHDAIASIASAIIAVGFFMMGTSTHRLHHQLKDLQGIKTKGDVSLHVGEQTVDLAKLHVARDENDMELLEVEASIKRRVG